MVPKATIINISKERVSYIESYAEHFNLNKCFRLSTSVRRISYDIATKKWILDIGGAGLETFDKVVVAMGINTIPNIPKLTGAELFEGDYIHSQSFKRYGVFSFSSLLAYLLYQT
jgi:dimethylaniline monooxygenase (N-oxide forming)